MDVDCYLLNSTEESNLIKTKINIDLPALEEIVVQTLLWGTAFTWIVAVIAFVLHMFYLKTSSNLYGYLHRLHISTGLVQLTLVTCYYSMVEHYTISIVLYELITLSNLLIPIWTACACWEIFLKLFLFVNGDNVYTKVDVIKFAAISVLVVQIYEELLIALLYYINFAMYGCQQVSVSAIRVTSIMLVTSMTLEIFFAIIFYSVKSSNVNRKLAFSFLLHLFLLLISDSILIAFKIDIWKQYKYKFNNTLTAVLLCIRMVGEMAWYIAVPYTKLPIYGTGDIYFS